MDTLKKKKGTPPLPPYLLNTEPSVFDKEKKPNWELVPDDGKPTLYDNPNLGTFYRSNN
jgi:hypothetical protein